MKRLAVLAMLATGAVAAQAQAPTFIDRARVQSAEPRYESVQVPRNECTSQWVNEPRPVAGSGGYGGAVIGGVAGAIVGNQIGKGHGREAATAAGAVIGALAGDRIANRDPYPAYEQAQREVRTCRTVYDVQTQLSGYRVTYEYRGHQYQTVLRDHPGQSLPVRVSVEPMEPEYHRR
jgi:uncharacterized protein YcfJ